MQLEQNVTYTEEMISKTFHSHALSHTKHSAIESLGDSVRDIKNKISEYIVSNYKEFLDPKTNRLIPTKASITKVRSIFP